MELALIDYSTGELQENFIQNLLILKPNLQCIGTFRLKILDLDIVKIVTSVAANPYITSLRHASVESGLGFH